MRRAVIGCGLAVFVAAGGCLLAGERDAGEPPEAPADVAADGFGREVDVAVSGAPELEPPLPVVDGEHHAVFDLLHNRPLGHRLQGRKGESTLIRGGGIDFPRYVKGNHTRDWWLDRTVRATDGESVSVAAVRGRTGKLTIPAVSAERAEVLQMRVFSPVDWDNELTVTVNGTEIGTASLQPGWQVVELSLDGEGRANNDVGLEFSNLGRVGGGRSGGAIDWIRVGPADTEAVASQKGESRVASQNEMTLAPEQGLSWVGWLHGDAMLDLEVAADPECGPAVRVAVEDEDKAGEIEVVAEHQIELVRGRGEVQPTAIDLEVESEQVGRVDLWNPGGDCGDLRLDTARMIRPGEPVGVPEDFEPPTYVVAWVIDTLRADYLPIHFDTDVQAPNLVELAEGGVSFANAYVQGTESRASHASLFTGKYPDRHGVMAGGTVHPRLPILSHTFRDADFQTAMFAANGYVSHLLNLDRGWDTYRNFIHEETALDAEFLADHGLDWIEGRYEEPFFLYLGTIDPHATYRKHDDFIGLYEPEDYSGRFRRHLSGEDLGAIKAGALTPNEREKERIINLYKNEITYNDAAFGEFRQKLEELGIWDDTLVIITSDHGEEFWEHGSVGHGHNVHQEMVHVPLIFHYPNGLPEGKVIASGGEVVDVLPTVREMLGLDPLEDRQGESLLPVMFGEHGGYPRPALATQYGYEYGLQIRDWKLYLDSGGARLYDRATDPLEMEDVSRQHPLAARWLHDAVGWYRPHRSEWDKSSWGVTNNLRDGFIDAVAED